MSTNIPSLQQLAFMEIVPWDLYMQVTGKFIETLTRLRKGELELWTLNRLRYNYLDQFLEVQQYYNRIRWVVGKLNAEARFYDAFLQKHNWIMSRAEMAEVIKSILPHDPLLGRHQPSTEPLPPLPAEYEVTIADHPDTPWMNGDHHQPNWQPSPTPPGEVAANNADHFAAHRAYPGLNGGHHQPNGQPVLTPLGEMAADNADPFAAHGACPGMNGGNDQYDGSNFRHRNNVRVYSDEHRISFQQVGWSRLRQEYDRSVGGE
ncbi:hypothetical protein BZA05DRAFT_449363 [Tricharina praecox]|uniref:uncharacterized protein n=1 Tax=Tricharina praecox TaxID=43433 RepID=UPI002220462E|nr:uncharacterized protein BZA05DRAFT_449363 [Tricharina praecox]KAI5842004.1 hypothetical protein BZA05DRAFT_449363 [Tricharina praecox]